MREDLYNGNMDEVAAATQKALDEGMPAQEILNNGLVGGMDIVLNPKAGWYRGDFHVHTSASDGDYPPSQVIK